MQHGLGRRCAMRKNCEKQEAVSLHRPPSPPQHLLTLLPFILSYPPNFHALSSYSIATCPLFPHFHSQLPNSHIKFFKALFVPFLPITLQFEGPSNYQFSFFPNSFSSRYTQFKTWVLTILLLHSVESWTWIVGNNPLEIQIGDQICRRLLRFVSL